MADSVMTYAITAGIFAFLTAVLFAARAKRYSRGYGQEESPSHAETA